MEQRAFVQYITTPDVHDGSVVAVQPSMFDPSVIRVLVRMYTDTLAVFTFSQVQAIHMQEPEGMKLYSLTEATAPPPYRCFRFTNWDDDDPRMLEIIAEHVEGILQADDSETPESGRFNGVSNA